MEQERKAGQEAGEYVTAGGLVNGGAELVEFTLVGRPFVGLADGHQNVSKQRVYGRGKWIVEVLCAKISTHGKAPWGPYFVSLSCGGVGEKSTVSWGGSQLAVNVFMKR